MANPSHKYFRQASIVATTPFYTLFTIIIAVWFYVVADQEQSVVVAPVGAWSGLAESSLVLPEAQASQPDQESIMAPTIGSGPCHQAAAIACPGRSGSWSLGATMPFDGAFLMRPELLMGSFGVGLHPESIKWAANEREDVIACLLDN